MEDNNKKENFVPAYDREQNENTNKNDVKKKKEKKVKSKISKIILIILAIIVVSVIVIVIYKLIKNNFDKSNVDYLDNMKAYGFDTMYDNKSAEPTEIVTKSEAIKLVITSMTNESDITKLVKIGDYISDYQDTMSEEEIEERLEYENMLWVEYAISMGVIQKGEITKENANDTLSLLDCLVYFANSKVKLLNKTLDTQTTPDIKNYDSYRVSEQLALSDMVYNQMVENDEDFEKTLTKEALNKLIIDMVIKYNTITVEGEKININKDKEPSNVKEYPYTLASVDKTIYELENYVENEKKYKNAKNSYIHIKEQYNAINSIIQDYMNTILNVNYENFDENKFKEDILDFSFHYENEKNVDAYIDYVKSNKIKIVGNAKVQYPAIYFDGKNYRVRVKVDYKIENAISKENLIYGDLSSKNSITYEKDEECLIVDIPVNKSIVSELMYIKIRPLKNSEAGKVKSDKESLNQDRIAQNDVEVPNSEDFEYTDSQFEQIGDQLIITPE